jgi:hypothetical protein
MRRETNFNVFICEESYRNIWRSAEDCRIFAALFRNKNLSIMETRNREEIVRGYALMTLGSLVAALCCAMSCSPSVIRVDSPLSKYVNLGGGGLLVSH